MEPEEEGTKNKELVQLEPREAHSFSRWRDGGRKMIVQHMDYDALALEARHEHEKTASLSHLARSKGRQQSNWRTSRGSGQIESLVRSDSPGLEIQEAATSDWQWRERILEDDSPSTAARTMQSP